MEEQAAKEHAATHIGEGDGQGHKHQSRPLFRGEAIGKYQRKHCHAREDGDQCVEKGDGQHGGANRGVTGEVGAVGHDRAHAQTQSEKSVPHGHQHGFAGQAAEVGVEQE